MTTQAMKIAFDTNNYLEVMEHKTRDQLNSMSEALFQLYQANTESLNRENLFRMVCSEN